MAQTGYTPILVYASGTASNVPLAANLTSSASGAELALNYADGKLYFKNSSGVVTLLASSAGASGDVVGPASATDNALARFDLTTGKLIQNSVGILSDAGVLTGLTGLTSSGNITLSALTSGRVPYASTGGLLVDSANLLYSGADLTVYGVRVGRGAGAVATNTAVGSGALASNATGIGQTAVGFSALGQSTGSRNVAFGGGDSATYNAALASNTSGTDNAAFGIGALSANLTGVANTSLGVGSLYFSTASNNTAVGYQAGYANQTGANLVLVGRAAGFSNKASNNTFVGDSAGFFNDTGTYNTFVGVNAGLSINTGAKNTIIGSYSGNQGGLDIRTASNYIVLSDGDGNPRAYWNGANPTFPGNATFSAGTANGVAYLNGSKVLTTGSALTFDGNNLSIGANGQVGSRLTVIANGAMATFNTGAAADGRIEYAYNGTNIFYTGVNSASLMMLMARSGVELGFGANNSEQMRLTSTGLGIGTISPGAKLDIVGASSNQIRVGSAATEHYRIGRNASDGLLDFYGSQTGFQGYRFGGIDGTWATINSSGNLGIGTISPANKLVVSNAGANGFEVDPANSLMQTYNRSGGAYTSMNLLALSMAFKTGASPATTMLLDSSGNLGIGTTPGTTLDVYKATGNSIVRAWAASGIPRFDLRSATRYYSISIQSDNLTFFDETAGSTRMTLDSSGNLGIGTTNPQQKLVVSLAGAQGLEISPDAVASAPSLVAYNRSGGAYVQLSSLALQHVWQSGASPSERMRLDSSGNFSLTKLALNIDSPFVTGANISSGSNPVALGTTGATVLHFFTNNTERARIDSSGNLLVGTQSSSASSDSGIKSLPASNGANNPQLAIVTSASANTTASLSLYSTGAGAYRFYVADGGTIYATSTSITGISDASLKENIRDLETGLSEVMALKPRRFDWKNGDAQNVAGFVAQEVAEVLPELVADYAYSKSDDGDDIIKKSLRMGDMLPTLVKAIQELKADLDATKAELAALKGA
jgi:hypothetical protein